MNGFDTRPAWTSGMSPFFPSMPEAALQAWKAAMTLPMKVTIESLRFYSARFAANAAHLERLLACETADQIIDEQSSFLNGAAKAYEQEAEVLSETLAAATGGTARAA